MAVIQLQGFHDAERRKCVIGSVKHLPRTKIRRRPIAGGNSLRLPKIFIELCADGRADPDLSLIPTPTEDMIEIEDPSERHPQSGPNLRPIVPQSKSNLQNLFGMQQISNQRPTLGSVKLKDKGPIPKRKLHDMRTTTFLPALEGGLRFRIETHRPREDDFLTRPLNTLNARREVNTFQGKPLEWLQKSGFGFRESNQTHQPIVAGGTLKCRGKQVHPDQRPPQTQAATEFRFDSTRASPQNAPLFLMRHTISVLVENKFGVLTRIAGMFSGRGFNIDSLNVGPTLDPTTSRMTIVVKGDDTTLEQVTKQLNKLIDVIVIEDFRDDEVVERELVLMRVSVNSETRAEVMQIGDIFRAKIIDVQINNLAIEITGNESKLDKFLMLMGKFGITELTRTGRVALARKSQ